MCSADLVGIAVTNTNTNAWAGSITVTRNGVALPLTCAGCGGEDFAGKIAVDGDEDGGGMAATNCVNKAVCKFTFPIVTPAPTHAPTQSPTEGATPSPTQSPTEGATPSPT